MLINCFYTLVGIDLYYSDTIQIKRELVSPDALSHLFLC